VTKFCLSVDIHDVITCATFCDDRLRGLAVARGRISRFPLTCVVALTTFPNQTFAITGGCCILHACWCIVVYWTSATS